MNTYRWVDYNEGGDVRTVSLVDGAFAEETVFTEAFLACPHYRFLSHGDGLVSICALEGTAVYGIVGPAEDHHVPAVRARLLQVRPWETSDG
jgi:hypothetical protein